MTNLNLTQFPLLLRTIFPVISSFLPIFSLSPTSSSRSRFIFASVSFSFFSYPAPSSIELHCIARRTKLVHCISQHSQHFSPSIHPSLTHQTPFLPNKKISIP